MNTNNMDDIPDIHGRDNINHSQDTRYNPSENGANSGKEHPLAPEIREWTANIPFNERNTVTNHLNFKWAFAEKIQLHIKTLYRENRIPLAQQIKMDYENIKTTIRDFDMHCEKRCYEEDEAEILESKRKNIETLGKNLANLIAGRCRLSLEQLNGREQERLKTETQRTPPIRIATLPPQPNNGQKDVSRSTVHSNSAQTIPTEWISFAEAAKLAGGVNKSTLTRWANEQKIQCNGKTGHDRKLNKISVILYKQAVDEKNQKKDDQDVAEDRGY
jgi:hypothetical protein